MRLADSRMQTLHALAASCVQSRQFFASTLREQLFELKNEEAIKKSENLRDTCACKGLSIKGTVSQDFLLLVFFASGFPQASDYTMRAVSNFFENLRRYSQLKVCHRCQGHRWQMEKTFKQKNFNNFVWTPLGSRVNIY
jgi:hypothetical protein